MQHLVSRKLFYVWNPTNPVVIRHYLLSHQAGTYQVEVTNTNTSCVNTDTIVVTLSSELWNQSQPL